MNTKTHEHKYNHNKSLIDGLDVEYNDWKITVIFYSALHLVEKYFDSTQLKSARRNHFTRKKLISEVTDLKKIYGEYDFLYTQSIKSRYDLKEFSDKTVQQSMASLQRIEEHLLKLLP